MESDDYIEYSPRRKHRFAAGVITTGLLLSVATAGDEVLNDGNGFEAVAEFKGQLNDDNPKPNKSPLTASARPQPSTKTTVSPSPDNSREDSNMECISKLPLKTRLGQMLIIGVQGDRLSTNATFFAKRQIGGAIIMSSPANPHDGSIKDFKYSGDIPVLIGTDEEGGARQEGGVQRFRNLGELPLAAKAPRSMSAKELSAAVALHGKRLDLIGIDMVFGPDIDITPKSGKAALPGRTYSSDPKVVTTFAGATLEGWQQAGILPTLKHFPGLGRGTGNTDYESATTPPLAELEKHELVPYANLSNTGAAVMIGNQVVPGLTDGQPASLSQDAVQLLRDKLGYADNLVVTDSLSAKAIPDTQAAITQAILAGADMAMVVSPPNGKTIRQTVDGALAKLTSLTGKQLPESQVNASVAQVLAAKGIADACTLD
jgi:beta-N-acetylhexosaminidase